MAFHSPSIVPGIEWPPIVPGNAATQMRAVLQHLENSQQLSPELLLERQLQQAGNVLKYAYQHTPYYHEKYRKAGVQPDSINWESWQKIPILKRTDVQQASDTLNSTRLPVAHGKKGRVTTSGSTGRPLSINTTDITRFFWRAFTLREHVWHQRDLSGKLAAIRRLKGNDSALPPDGQKRKGWGASTDALYTTGPAVLLNVLSTIEEQGDWLCRENPDYLLTYPSLVAALAKHFMASGQSLTNLKEIRTFGEIVTPATREACKSAWGVALVDTYSSVELGYIALQCPEHEHYHIQSENLLVEILDDEDKPCKPGQIGRVIATTLHNFATPLIRYEVGDFAEVGHPCPCGRGLPVLNRIFGRARNMLHLPNGDMRWPIVGQSVPGIEKLPAVRQYQLVQKSLEEIEARVVIQEKLTPEQEAILVEAILKPLGHPFKLKLVYCDEIKRSAGGKFEDFISEIT